MKKIYQYICILAAMLLSVPTVATAQSSGDDKGELILKKTVTETPDESDGHYTINIEAYATGSQIEVTTYEKMPADIVLALDYSSSMVNNSSEAYSSTKNPQMPGYYAVKNDYNYNNSMIDVDGKNYPLEPYFYKYTDGKYYVVNREEKEPSTTSNYYFLKYKDDNNNYYYLQPAGGAPTAEMPAGDINKVYTGPLYQVAAPAPGAEYYYASIEKNGKTYYWDNEWKEGLNNLPAKYKYGTYKPAEQVLFHGQLYDENGTAYQGEQDYTYNQLSGLTNKYVGEEVNYYYLKYTLNGTEYYLPGNTTAAPTNPDETVYTGRLYKKQSEVNTNPNCYRIYYENKGQKKYIVPNENGGYKIGNFSDINGTYESNHKNVTDVAFVGILYDNNGNALSTTTYTFETIKGKYYPIVESPKNKKDVKPIQVEEPSGTDLGATITKYVETPTGAGSERHAWKWNDDYEAEQLYYKVGEEYAQVNGGGKTTDLVYYPLHVSEPTYTSTQYGLVGDKAWKYNELNNKNYFYLAGEEYYPVELDGPHTAGGEEYTGYGLYIEVNGEKKYLKGTGIVESGNPYVSDETTTIYSGYLYSNTRIAALQAAVEAFLNTVTEMSKGEDHEWGGGDDLSNNVAVELFADHRRGITELLPFGTEQDARESTATILQLVNNTNTATGTGHDIGMYDARAILADAKEEGRSQSVVMFTDGEPYANKTRFKVGDKDADGNHIKPVPGHDGTVYEPSLTKSYGSDDQRIEIAQQAVRISKDIKDAGATVYVVSLLDESVINGKYKYVEQYVEYMSSKYPKAETITGREEGTSEPNEAYRPAVWLNDEHTESYCMAYSEDNDLTSIFTTIAEHTSTEGHGTAVTANETSVVVFDAMTDHFKLPDGADASKISVWAVPCTGKSTGTDGTVTYTFNENEKVFKTADAANVMSNIDVKVAGKVVNVIGFDYAGNYCGEHGTEEVSGYKLVISFPIYIDPANPGGTYLQTNEATSGIYYTKDEDEDGKPDTQDGLYELGESVKPLPVPHVDLPNIVIRKKGLTKPGESATFLIEPVGGTAGEAFSVVITCKDAADAANANTGIYAKVKLQAEGRYKVTETSWAWGYTPEATGGFTKDDTHSVKEGLSITRNVCKATQEPDGITKKGVGTIFEFTNTKNNNYDEMKYSEAYKRNVFYTPSKYTWTNSIGSGTEVEVGGGEGDPD